MILINKATTYITSWLLLESERLWEKGGNIP